MALTRVTDLIDEIEAFQLNQYAALLEGDTAAGHPVAITALNDSTNYAVQIANQDTTNARAFRVFKANLTDPWIQVDVSGVTLEKMRLRTITAPTAPGSNLMEVYPDSSDNLYLRAGAAGATRRVMDGGIFTTRGAMVYASTAGVLTQFVAGSNDYGLHVVGGVPSWEPSLRSNLAARGDIIYASTALTPAALPAGSANYALYVSSTGIPTWQPSPRSVLATTGAMLYASSANTLAQVTPGTTAQLLHGGSAPSFGSVVTADIAPNNVTNMLLAFTQTVSLGTAALITATTAYVYLSTQTFVVAQSNSWLQFSARGMAQVRQSTVGAVASRIIIDGNTAAPYYLGAHRVMVTGEFANPFAGAGALWLQLSASTHTVAIHFWAEGTGEVYARHNGFEEFSFAVVEHLR